MTPKRKPARETWTGGALPDGLFTRDVTVYVTTWRALAAACIAFYEEEGWGTVGYEPGILFRHEDGRTVDMPTWLALRIQSGKVRAAELEAALRALVEAMPRCQHGGCRLHAVARHIGTGLVCEVHAASISELRLSALPLSPQLRAALLLLAKGWTR